MQNGLSVVLQFGMGYFNEDATIIIPLFSCSIIFYLVILTYKRYVSNSIFIFDTILIFALLWIQGKRRMIASVLIMALFSLSISGVVKGKKFIRVFGVASVSIVIFAYLYGVFLKGNVSSLRDYFGIDLARDYSLIYQFYCHRIGRKISVSYGDAIVYILLFWIPRSWWPNKPYPFANSITRSLLGFAPSNTNLGWATTVSIFSDLYDTFFAPGLLIGIILICKLCKMLDRNSKATNKILLIYLIVHLLTVQLSSSLIAIFISYFLLRFCDMLKSKKLTIQSM